MNKEKSGSGNMATILVGIFAWIPIMGVLGVLSWIIGLLAKLANALTAIPLFHKIFQISALTRIMEYWVAIIITFLIILAVLYVTGFILKTWWGKKLKHHIDSKILCRIPLYRIFHKIVTTLAGEDGQKSFFDRFRKVAFVHTFGNGAFEIALVTASHSKYKSLAAQFMPTGPNITSGNIRMVPVEYVHITDIKPADAMIAIASCGVSSEKLIETYIEQNIASGNHSLSLCALGMACPLHREIRNNLIQKTVQSP